MHQFALQLGLSTRFHFTRCTSSVHPARLIISSTVSKLHHNFQFLSFTDILAGFAFNNRILCLPAIVFNTTVCLGKLGRTPGEGSSFRGNVMLKTIAGRRKILLLNFFLLEKCRTRYSWFVRTEKFSNFAKKNGWERTEKSSVSVCWGKSAELRNQSLPLLSRCVACVGSQFDLMCGSGASIQLSFQIAASGLVSANTPWLDFLPILVVFFLFYYFFYFLHHGSKSWRKSLKKLHEELLVKYATKVPFLSVLEFLAVYKSGPVVSESSFSLTRMQEWLRMFTWKLAHVFIMFRASILCVVFFFIFVPRLSCGLAKLKNRVYISLYHFISDGCKANAEKSITERMRIVGDVYDIERGE